MGEIKSTQEYSVIKCEQRQERGRIDKERDQVECSG
jgi:hypothetical protein